MTTERLETEAICYIEAGAANVKRAQEQGPSATPVALRYLADAFGQLAFARRLLDAVDAERERQERQR